MWEKTLGPRDTETGSWRSDQGHGKDKAQPEGIWDGFHYSIVFHLSRILNLIPVRVDLPEHWPNIASRKRAVVFVSLERESSSRSRRDGHVTGPTTIAGMPTWQSLLSLQGVSSLGLSVFIHLFSLICIFNCFFS